MTGRTIVAVWLALLLALAAEFTAAHLPHATLTTMAIATAMALAAAAGFMRLTTLRGPAAIFALAGLFWLAVLLGLGNLDIATRHDIGVGLS